MKRLNTLIYAILAGVVIGIGGLVYLSVENPIAGSFLFTLGLFTVCTFSLNLFTGKVAYLFDNDKSYIIDVITIWIGNLIGTASVGLLARMTRIVTTMKGDITILDKAVKVASTKLSDDILSVFILAIFCNLLIFIAVDVYKNHPHEIAKYLGLIFGVMVFILAGFEHCIANMFYFTFAGSWSMHTLLFVLVATAGNAVGGWILPLARKLRDKYGDTLQH